MATTKLHRPKTDPLTVLRADRQQALHLAEHTSVAHTRRLLQKAQAKLNERLRQVEGLAGAGAESFSAAQLRITLAQVRGALRFVTGGMAETIQGEGRRTAEQAVQHTLEYVQRADQKYMGIAQRLPIREAAVLSRAVKGTQSSILNRLQGDAVVGPGILARYGDNVIKKFEERLQMRFLAKTPWNEVRNELVADSPFLQQAPAHWSERIVRTEVMAAHNTASWEGLRATNKAIGGGMLKILCATFDSRTAADSYAVHGQIRRPSEAFETWQGFMQAPPARPNDREVIVPHNMDWPIPASLAWKSDAEVAARWRAEGHKKSMPSRPKMTTVPLNKIGAVDEKSSKA